MEDACGCALLGHSLILHIHQVSLWLLPCPNDRVAHAEQASK